MNLGEFRAKWSRLFDSGEPTLQSGDSSCSALPDEAQLDLLRAALLPAEQAAPAWRRWKERDVALEAVDGASARMFPQLWANRVAAGVGSEDIPLLKAVSQRKEPLSTVGRIR